MHLFLDIIKNQNILWNIFLLFLIIFLRLWIYLISLLLLNKNIFFNKNYFSNLTLNYFQLIDDPDVKIKLKTQSLIYPALQILDVDLPSYRENSHFPVLSKSLMVRFWSEYFTTDRSLENAMFFNQHVPVESSHLFKFVNWSSLLPEKFKKGHFYNSPTYGSSELAKKYPGFLDVRAAPLLADDSKLHKLPLTYVLTCQYDVLRDDGIMYVTRLQKAGVRVTHDHIEDGFHGAVSIQGFKIRYRLENQHVSWLSQNL